MAIMVNIRRDAYKPNLGASILVDNSLDWSELRQKREREIELIVDAYGLSTIHEIVCS